MSDTKNKPTTKKQKMLIVLITVVLLLLVVQSVGIGDDADTELPTDRETCLSSGYIWSQSSETCYDDSTAETSSVDQAQGSEHAQLL